MTTEQRRTTLFWRTYRKVYVLRDRILARLLGPAAEGQELVCVLAALVWGLVILTTKSPIPGDTALAAMERHAPAAAWAAAFLAFGVLGLVAYVRHWRRVRVFCAVAGFVGWSLMAWYALVPPRPIFSAAITPLFALGSLLSFLRLVEVKA